VYPKVSGVAAWSENCKWHSFLPLGAVVSLFCLFLLLLLLSLSPQPSLGLGFLHKIWLNFLRLLNNFLFYRVGLLAPRPTPIPEVQTSVFISPRGRVATHFSRLLDTHGLRCYIPSNSLLTVLALFDVITRADSKACYTCINPEINRNVEEKAEISDTHV
jgi:hypothetical protein